MSPHDHMSNEPMEYGQSRAVSADTNMVTSMSAAAGYGMTT